MSDRPLIQEQWVLLARLASAHCSSKTNVYYGPFPSSDAAVAYTQVIKTQVNSHPDTRFDLLPLLQPEFENHYLRNEEVNF